MIIKKRNKTELDQYEALLSRMRPDHPKFREVESDYVRRKKGYIGEKQVDYYLEELVYEMTILQDLNLSVEGKNMQLDNLLISQHAAYIVEVKNFTGSITFDTELQQFTRDDSTQERGFRHPILQAELQKQRLQAWLQEMNLPPIPIYYFIAISDPSTIIKVEGNKEEIAKVVAHAAHIPNKIKQHEARGSKQQPIQHQKLGHYLMQAARKREYKLMRNYEIRPEDILPGVRCPGCGYLGMRRLYGKWLCPKCKMISKEAHKRAIYDYLFLIQPTISNRECRRHLNISSKNIATKLLKKELVYDKTKRSWKKR
ncbi:nuclease-related domain-containing protein [Oceanobacillus jordanicus]|uniref:NERD domain-containing protein n=1 Tax=Oceanobacillus jordanicus TaxID=2867266 RepID=A0AAW5B1G9_9BACI|nr:nuclease-related domain-containing protein [Oceanobacillus jordanicus]MCG3418147.1 NERD domain-containing protein [Oceanobacillus jordanicus]